MKISIGPATIIHPLPVLIVGSYNKEGQPNIMNASWGGICCSKPPCIAVSLRKETLTYHNIRESKAFTINIPSEKFLTEADFAGQVSGREFDKFAELNLTVTKSELVNAPYIEEFPLVLECAVLHVVEIGIHTQFIGEIKDVKAEKSVLGENGLPRIELVRPLIYGGSGSRSYYGIGDKIADVGVSKN